jgi:Saxitoxin biosynthesis operon protein SxtJ
VLQHAAGAAPGKWRGRVARVYGGWLAVAHVIGNFQARVLLSAFYFLVVPPFAVVVRLARDPLQLRPVPGRSFWIERTVEPTFMDAQRQY